MTEPNTESRMRPNAAPFYPSQSFSAALHFPHLTQVPMPSRSPMQLTNPVVGGGGGTGGLNPNAPEFIPGVTRPPSANLPPLADGSWTVPAIRPNLLVPTSAMVYGAQPMNEPRRFIASNRMATPTQAPYPEVDPWGTHSTPAMSPSMHIATASNAAVSIRHPAPPQSPPSVPQEVVSFTHFATMPVPRQSRPVSATRAENALVPQSKERSPALVPATRYAASSSRPIIHQRSNRETPSNWRSPNETSHSHREEPEAELEDVFGPPTSGGGVSAVSSRTRAPPPVAATPTQPDVANEYYLEDDIDREGVKIISLNSDDDERAVSHPRGGHRGAGRRGGGRGGGRGALNSRHGGRGGTDHAPRGGGRGRGGYERGSRRGGNTVNRSPAMADAENSQSQPVKEKQRSTAPAPQRAPVTPEEEPVLAPKQETAPLPGAHPGDQVWKQFRRTAGWLQGGEEAQIRSEASSDAGPMSASPTARKVIATPTAAAPKENHEMRPDSHTAPPSNTNASRLGGNNLTSGSRSWSHAAVKSRSHSRQIEAPVIKEKAPSSIDGAKGTDPSTTRPESDWTQVVHNRRQHHLSATPKEVTVTTSQPPSGAPPTKEILPKKEGSYQSQSKAQPVTTVTVVAPPMSVWQQGRRLRKASAQPEAVEVVSPQPKQDSEKQSSSDGVAIDKGAPKAIENVSAEVTIPKEKPEEPAVPPDSIESAASTNPQKKSLMRLAEKPRGASTSLPDKGVYVPPSKRNKMREEAERAAAEKARLEAEAAEKARIEEQLAREKEQQEREIAEARKIAEQEAIRRDEEAREEEKQRKEAEAAAAMKEAEERAAQEEKAAQEAKAIEEARAAQEEKDALQDKVAEEAKAAQVVTTAAASEEKAPQGEISQQEEVKRANDEGKDKKEDGDKEQIEGEEAGKMVKTEAKLERASKAVGFPKISAKFGRASMSLEKADALAKLDAETINPPKPATTNQTVTSSLMKGFTSLLGTSTPILSPSFEVPAGSTIFSSSSAPQDGGESASAPTIPADTTSGSTQVVNVDPEWPEPEINAAGKRIWSVESLMKVRNFPSCNAKNKAMSGRFVVNFLESQRLRQTRSTAGHEYAMWEPSRAAEILPIKPQVLSEKFTRDGFKLSTRSADIPSRVDSWRNEVKPVTPLPVLPETAWSVTQKKEKEAGDEIKLFTRRLRGMLNKLTIEKFEELYPQFLALITKPEEVAVAINLIFEKATTQHSYIEMYADLTVRLDEDLLANGVLKAPTTEEKKAGKAPSEGTLRSMVLKACQDSFQDNLLGEFSPPDDVDEEDKFELLLKYKTRMKGNLKFAGELLKRGMMHSRVAGLIMEKLMDHKGEHQLEALASFMTTVGPFLENHSSYAQSQLYHGRLERIRALTTDPDVPHRVQCLLKDVCEQRVPAPNSKSTAGT